MSSHLRPPTKKESPKIQAPKRTTAISVQEWTNENPTAQRVAPTPKRTTAISVQELIRSFTPIAPEQQKKQKKPKPKQKK